MTLSHADSRSMVVARIAVLAAMGSVLGYAETVLMPASPFPGLRLGLANLAVLIAFALLGSSAALAVTLMRVFIVGLATGSLLAPTGALSLAGALAAWFAISLVMHTGGDAFSVVGWSVAGSTAHVLAQLGAACMLVGSVYPLALAPVSLVAAVCAGVAIGWCARVLLSRVPFMKVSYA